MTVMTFADVLEQAADLIEPEGAWTRDANARDRQGYSTGVADPEACSFCMAGAIGRVMGSGKAFSDETRPVLDLLETTLGHGVPYFNDFVAKTQAKAVAALREAAAKAREDAK